MIAGCESGPKVPDWSINAVGHAERFTEAYFSGNTRIEAREFALARAEVARTGRADLVARIELTRYSARVASLEFGPCEGFEPLRADASDAERAYAHYLAGQVSAQDAAQAVETASHQGWRRPLLAWLGVQARLADERGDAAEAARIRRRMDLVQPAVQITPRP